MAVGDPLRAAVERHLVSGADPVAPGSLEARIGYRFANRKLLQEALTHESSLKGGRARNRAAAKTRSNERLEFLGDRVVALMVAEMLMRQFPDEAEGPLTHRLIGLVNGDALAEIGMEMELSEALVVGNQDGARQSVDPGQASVVGDACEALIGAVYLDGGPEAARALVQRYWSQRILTDQSPPRHPKQLLQEWLAARQQPAPAYRLVRTEGPAHAPQFTVSVEVQGRAPIEAHGSSKRVAELNCAELMLAELQGKRS